MDIYLEPKVRLHTPSGTAVRPTSVLKLYCVILLIRNEGIGLSS